MKEKQEFIESVKHIVEYWSRQSDQTDYEKCDGVAFSILNLLDGNKAFMPAYEVRPLDDEGNAGEDIAGSLHELYNALESEEDESDT